MYLTNILNLPLPLVKAVENDKYESGNSDYTTSQLAGTPARQFALKKKHWNDLTEDVADRIYSLSGQSKHVILERAAEFCPEYEYLAEKRFFIERNGKRISGQVDLYDRANKILYDWKEVSVYVSKKDLKPEWIGQGNVNRLLMMENGYEVERLINIALYRDWRKSQTDSKDYPKHQVEPFELPVWTLPDTEEFIARRVQEFEAAMVNLPECSAEERWYSGDKFALMKRGNKKATKVFNTESEVQQHREIFNLMDGYEIQFRTGENKRCQHYCLVNSVCSWWQQNQPKENGNGTE